MFCQIIYIFVENYNSIHMQRIVLLLSLLWSASLQAQTRYLDEVFDSVTTTLDVFYGTATNASGSTDSLRMDFYFPANDPNPTNRPVIIWAHGGSFINGSRTSSEIVPFAERFAKRGFVCVSISYRLGLDGFPPNQQIVLRSVIRAVQDGKGVVRFLRANADTYGIDTTKIFFGGSSAGAILALHAGYLSSNQEFQLEADSSLITGLGGLEGGNSAAPGYSSKVHGIINLCGALGEKVWIESGDIPVVSVHGDDDQTVPYGTDEIRFQNIPLGLTVDGSYSLHRYADSIGVSSALKTFYGQGHVPYNGNQTYLDSTINFVAPIVYSWLGLSSKTTALLQYKIHLFPNPAQHAATLQTNSPEPLTATLYNLHGQTLYQVTFTKSTQVPTEHLPQGLYLLKVSSQDQILQTLKLVKE